jgi:Arc/MetJ-type ribon-helix-helix transcriptional regulator
MTTRNVVLSQDQHELVEALVESGPCQNASAVSAQAISSAPKRANGTEN